MLSTCGDKRLLSSCLSPHRICTLVCIREMTQWEAWQLDGGNMNDSITDNSLVARSFDSEVARRNIYTAVYKLTQCAEAMSKDEFLADLRDHHQCCPDFIDCVKLAFKVIVDLPLDSLLELFVVLPEIVSSEATMAISGTSPVGIYMRQSILAFNRLDFAQIEKVSRKVCDFIEPPVEVNTSTSAKSRFGASKSFLEFERSRPFLPIEDQSVFLRYEPYSDENGKGEVTTGEHRQPDSYFSHHLDLMAQSFFRCSTEALISYFSRNFKNRMPDIVVREPHSNYLIRETKSKPAICSSRFETILLGFVAGVSGDSAGCLSLLIDATKQCHSAGDIVGVELANLMSLLIFGTELNANSADTSGASIQALLDQASNGSPTSDLSALSSIPLTPEGLKYLAFVNFHKAVIDILRTDQKQLPLSTQIANLVNAYLPVIDRASPVESTQLSLFLMQTMSLVYRLHGEVGLAASFDLVTLYMNAEFSPGRFFGTSPVLRAWQDLALNSWSCPATAGVLCQRIGTLFPKQPETGRRLVDLVSNFKVKLITGDFSAAEQDVVQLFSVDKNEAAVLLACYLLETGQLYEMDAHYKEIVGQDPVALPLLYRLRLSLIRGLYFVALNDYTQALETFDELISQCELKPDADKLLVSSLSSSVTGRYSHLGIKALIYMYKALVLLRLNFASKARYLLESKVAILCPVFCSNLIVGQTYYLSGVAEALLRNLSQASHHLNQAAHIFAQIDAQPMLVQTYSAAALIAQARGDTKSRNVCSHKLLAARQELTERDRIWVDTDVWKLSPFYFIDTLIGSLNIVKN